MKESLHKSFLAAVVLLVATLLTVNAWAEKQIGFLIFSNETRYMETAKGVKDKLSEAGYTESNTHYIIAKTAGNKAKALELVRKFASEKLDLIISLGTTSTLIVAKEIKDVPIVFSNVYDPVGSGIAKSWKSSGNKTTGSSSKIPMVKVLQSLELLRPIKRLAVLYTPGEKNSEAAVRDLQNIQVKLGLTIIPVIVSSSEDIDQILPQVLTTADGLYITGSNMVKSRMKTIIDMASKSGIITVSHIDDLIEEGVLVGVCANSYSMGRLAGEKAVKILHGAKPSSLPIEAPTKYDVMLNMKTAKKGNFLIPPEFMKTVTRKIE